MVGGMWELKKEGGKSYKNEIDFSSNGRNQFERGGIKLARNEVEPVA
jgi:hypothetical protein